MTDSAYALYLQSPERLFVSTDATLATRWGDLARSVETSSCLTTETDANNEALRELAFLGGPLAREAAIVAGIYPSASYRGRCVTIDGSVMFVLGANPDHAGGFTRFDVLRRL